MYIEQQEEPMFSLKKWCVSRVAAIDEKIEFCKEQIATCRYENNLVSAGSNHRIHNGGVIDHHEKKIRRLERWKKFYQVVAT